MSNTCVIGATTWGNTLAELIASKGMPVRVWSNSEEKASNLQNQQKEKSGKTRQLIEFTADLDYAVSGCEVAIFAVPAQSLRSSARLFAGKLEKYCVLVSAAKGLEAATGKRMTEILSEEIIPDSEARLAVISGPNLSKEICMGLPAVTIIASKGISSTNTISELLSSDSFSVYTSNDVKGVEICGALKNVIALGAGLVDGMRLGSNAKAALVTVGWNEVIRLGKKLGAEESTFYGFAGLGDLLTTCISPLSRNYHVGFELADGKPLKTVLAGMSNVVEGIDTTKATHLLCAKNGLQLPLMEAIYGVLSGYTAPSDITRHFLNNRVLNC